LDTPPDTPAIDTDPATVDVDYEPPLLIDLGHVRDVTLGSTNRGNADANSQYYP
jgi:hypothetical protein